MRLSMTSVSAEIGSLFSRRTTLTEELPTFFILHLMIPIQNRIAKQNAVSAIAKRGKFDARSAGSRKILSLSASSGEVLERLNRPVSKTGVGVTPPWVRIPPSPFFNLVRFAQLANST